MILLSTSGDQITATAVNTIKDRVEYELDFTGDTVDNGDFACWTRQDLALDCSLCPTLTYPQHGGVVANLQQTVTLDGDVDGGGSLPDSLSGTFVLCLAHAEDFTAGTVPDADSFNLYPYVQMLTRHDPPSPPPSPPPPSPPPPALPPHESWVIGDISSSCADACMITGLWCDDDAFTAANHDVDTRAELEAVLAGAGGAANSADFTCPAYSEGTDVLFPALQISGLFPCFGLETGSTRAADCDATQLNFRRICKQRLSNSLPSYPLTTQL